MNMKNLKNRVVSVFRPKVRIIDPPKPKPFTKEQMKKAKVSSGTLERDILEQREIRRLERPNGRRAFFRGVAGAVGLKVLAEKIPEAYFESNYLDHFPELARFVPEAEADMFFVLGSGGNRRCQTGQQVLPNNPGSGAHSFQMSYRQRGNHSHIKGTHTYRSWIHSGKGGWGQQGNPKVVTRCYHRKVTKRVCRQTSPWGAPTCRDVEVYE